MAQQDTLMSGGKTGRSEYTRDIGNTGESYAQQVSTVVPNPMAGGEKLAKAKAEQMDAQANLQNSEILNSSINQAIKGMDIFAEQYKNNKQAEVTHSVTAQLGALQQGFQIEKSGGFTAEALKNPDVLAAYNEMQAVKTLQDQGYSTPAATKLRAEAIIKKYSNQSPAFAQEIRKVGADTLGFDPTGTQIKMLSGMEGGAAEKTPEQKGIEAAQQEYAQKIQGLQLAGFTEEQAAQAVSQEAQWKQQQNQFEAQLKQNQVSVIQNGQANTKVVGAVDAEIANQTSNLISAASAVITNKGSLDPQTMQGFKIQVEQSKQAYINKTLMAMPDTATVEDRQKVVGYIEDRYNQIGTLIENGSMEKLVTSVVNTLPKQQLINIMPKVPQLINLVALGQAGVTDINSMITFSESYRNMNQAQLSKIDPKAAAAMDALDMPATALNFSTNIYNGKTPVVQNDGEKFVAVNTAKNVLATPGAPAQAKQTAVQTILSQGGTVGLLQTYLDPKVENTVRTDNESKSNFRNIYTSALSTTVPGMRALIAEQKARGVEVIVDPKSGKVTFGNNFTNTASTQALATNPVVKQYEYLLQITRKYPDVLNLGLPDKTISELSTEIQQPLETKESPKSQKGGAINVSSIQNANPQLASVMGAISQVESGDRYNARGPTVPSGRYAGESALGRYQIMPGNLAAWSREALGREVTPEEFLANPELQDQIAGFQMNKHLQSGRSPQEVASIWHSGSSNPGKSRDLATGITTKQYVKNVSRNLG